MARSRLNYWFIPLLVGMLCGCGTAPIKFSESHATPLAYHYAAIPKVGDSIEINYYPNSMLEDQPYVVNVGDVLRIDVMNHPELTREGVLVLPDGHISVPTVSRFSVVGKNLDELAEELKVIYRNRRIADPMVTVSVVQADSQLNTLMRSISRNGRVEPFTVMVDESGMLDLPFIVPVSAAQPLNKIREEIRGAYRQRFGGRLEVTANLNRRESPVVYVIGEVTTPGRINYSRSLAPIMAVAAAGGFRNTAKYDEVRLMRYGIDGHLDQWPLDMNAALKGGQLPPMELLPGDIIFVPKTGVAHANDVIEQYVRKMIPIGIGVGFSYELNQK